jgi:predicted Zn-dependent peptidase
MENKDIKLMDGVYIHCMKTDRFKTNYIYITLLTRLNRETVTKNALIPLVLRRGTRSYPTMQDISIKLDEMYGSSMDANVDKMGDYMAIQLMMEMISDEYALEKSEILKDGIDLISEILLKPVLENGAFKKEYVEQEKETLKELINSKINDKGNYAFNTAIEKLYKDEPYGLYKYGYVEDLDKINARNLYEQYLDVLRDSEIHIYVSGNFNEIEVADEFNSYFENVDRNFNNWIALGKASKALGSVMEVFKRTDDSNTDIVVEHQNVIQGKLVLGYTLRAFNEKADFYPMTVYSAILGGTASSKLFNNVREKKSLAYTIRSQYIKHKGAMFVNAGIENENCLLAKECIFKEIEDMRTGEFTEEEIHDAKVNLVTRFRSFNDSQAAMIGWSVGQKLLGGDEDLDVVIDNINKVSKAQILDVANRLELSMTYFLTK